SSFNHSWDGACHLSHAGRRIVVDDLRDSLTASRGLAATDSGRCSRGHSRSYCPGQQPGRDSSLAGHSAGGMAHEKCTGGNDNGRCSGVDTTAFTLTGPRELFLVTLPHIKIVRHLITS